jgi:hypothetical protein
MRTTLCFTSFNFAYATKACILAKTLKIYNPDWIIAAVISDSEGDWRLGLVEKYFDEVVFSHQIDIPDFSRLEAEYSVVELCTAVKGDAACYFLDRNYKNVIYLDPDIAVFSSLSFMEKLLIDNSILLTPHQLEPDEKEDVTSIIDNEVGSLKYGIFNLGYIGFANDDEGRRCARWWKDRLNHKCIDSPGDGYFTDQKWCNHIPVFFNGVHIIRDCGCNVASWNLNKRIISFDQIGRILVNEDTLKFYHFTKFGPLGRLMTERYAKDNFQAFELWAYYQRQLDLLEEELLSDRNEENTAAL